MMARNGVLPLMIFAAMCGDGWPCVSASRPTEPSLCFAALVPKTAAEQRYKDGTALHCPALLLSCAARVPEPC